MARLAVKRFVVMPHANSFLRVVLTPRAKAQCPFG